jgi:chemotaxis protein MotB
MGKLVMLRRRLALLALSGLATVALAGCVSVQKYDALEQKYQQLQAQLGAELAADQAQIKMLQGELKITVVNEILFPEGGFTLNEKGQATLRKIVPALQGLQQTKVIVDGYTDNVPVGPDLARFGISNNLDLSSRRADGVATFLVQQGVNQNLVSAQGFGDSNPIASNDTPAGRAKNRRIEVTLRGPGT